MEILYTAVAHASGGGRDGHVRSEDDKIDFDVRPPKEIGGSGEGVNPEQLFAAAYSACFLSAVHGAGKKLELDTTDAAVSASVSFGNVEEGGYGLSVDLDIYTPNVAPDRREELAAAAHALCPHSRATRGNIEVKLTPVD
ncbi:MAG: organic hydroperoxide resistance protein [Homoserinimonas sp.]|jgi:osmotically inducible protein OsmC|nr:organic hydroperoxide resistance protein [Homoserinimonas sp.]